MLNFDTPTGGTQRGGGQRQRSGIPNLKTENCSLEKRVTTILAVRDQPEINKCTVKINYGGAVYLWNLKHTNPNLRTLADLFGKEESQWAGRKFYLANHEDEFSGVVFPTVMGEADTDDKPTSSRKR